MSTPEYRPHRAGLARMVHGSGPIGLIKPFEYREMKGAAGNWTQQGLIADSLTFNESISRAETCVITNA